MNTHVKRMCAQIARKGSKARIARATRVQMYDTKEHAIPKEQVATQGNIHTRSFLIAKEHVATQRVRLYIVISGCNLAKMAFVTDVM